VANDPRFAESNRRSALYGSLTCASVRDSLSVATFKCCAIMRRQWPNSFFDSFVRIDWSDHFLSFHQPSFLTPIFVVLALSALSALAQTSRVNAVTCGAGFGPGLVAESVLKNTEAATTGLAAGDLLPSWSWGDIRGEIESPSFYPQ
jgi:hypothetical protein